MAKIPKLPISVVISAHNEEHMIVQCLSSVLWADEIIVIDSGSTDKTGKLARKYGAKVFKRPNNLMLNVNKNFGFSKASHLWILNLDADEHVESSMRSEIKKILSNSQNAADGYKIPRKNFIFGKWITHSGWYPDYQIRLFKKNKGRFPEQHVHEKLYIKGTIKKLNSHIIHTNYISISQFLQKIDLYSENEAEVLLKKGYLFSKKDVITFPAREFFNRYFGHRGYNDGFYGIILALLMSFYHFIVYLKIWEKMNFPDKEMNFDEVNKEIVKFYKEYRKLSEKPKGKRSIIDKIIDRLL